MSWQVWSQLSLFLACLITDVKVMSFDAWHGAEWTFERYNEREAIGRDNEEQKRHFPTSGHFETSLLYLLKRSWQFPNARQLIEIPSLMWKNAAYGLWKLAGWYLWLRCDQYSRVRNELSLEQKYLQGMGSENVPVWVCVFNIYYIAYDKSKSAVFDNYQHDWKCNIDFIKLFNIK